MLRRIKHLEGAGELRSRDSCKIKLYCSYKLVELLEVFSLYFHLFSLLTIASMKMHLEGSKISFTIKAT